MEKFTTGLDAVYWGDVGDTPTRWISEIVNPSCPKAGEIRWANICSYHGTPIGGRIWLMYQPGLSALNGWKEHPEELDDSLLVECEIIARHEPDWYIEKLVKTLAKLKREDPEAFAALAELGFPDPLSPIDEYRGVADKYRGLVQLICHQVVPLIEIPNHFPATQKEFLPPLITTPCHLVGTEKLEYWCHWDSGGGAFESWLTTKATPRRLLLYCLYISSDPFEIHNLILPD